MWYYWSVEQDIVLNMGSEMVIDQTGKAPVTIEIPSVGKT